MDVSYCEDCVPFHARPVYVAWERKLRKDMLPNRVGVLTQYNYER